MTPPQIPDLHFAMDPIQIGNQIMVRVQICDNFGMTFQLVIPPKIANTLGMQARAAADAAETTLVKPPDALLAN